MSEKNEWKMLHGAKVKSPNDMPDDVLEDAVTTSVRLLSDCKELKPDEDAQMKLNTAIQTIKEHMDDKWAESGGRWHVVVGRNFGSLVTHESNHFAYFYVADQAVMIFKA